jgi:hypothetical protein
MAIALEAVDPAPPIASRQMRNAIVASVLGWSICSIWWRGLLSGYLPTFLKVVNGVPNSVSSLILMGASVVALVSAILFGAVSELIGWPSVSLRRERIL